MAAWYDCPADSLRRRELAWTEEERVEKMSLRSACIAPGAPRVAELQVLVRGMPVAAGPRACGWQTRLAVQVPLALLNGATHQTVVTDVNSSH